MDYTDFENMILNRRGNKVFKVSNSWGAYDAYKYIRKNKLYNIGRPLKEKEFYAIIRKVNDLLAEELAKGNPIKFPMSMGKLEIRRFNPGAEFKGGKLKVTYPINWNKTLKLWYSSKEDRKSKTLIRTESKQVYFVKYNKYHANYNNRCFYEFSLNRFISRALKDNIDKQLIDTLW